MSTCQCDLCKRNREWRERGIPSDVIDYVLDIEFELDYYKAIHKGKWDNGKKILEQALKKYEE